MNSELMGLHGYSIVRLQPPDTPRFLTEPLPKSKVSQPLNRYKHLAKHFRELAKRALTDSGNDANWPVTVGTADYAVFTKMADLCEQVCRDFSE